MALGAVPPSVSWFQFRHNSYFDILLGSEVRYSVWSCAVSYLLGYPLWLYLAHLLWAIQPTDILGICFSLLYFTLPSAILTLLCLYLPVYM